MAGAKKEEKGNREGINKHLVSPPPKDNIVIIGIKRRKKPGKQVISEKHPCTYGHELPIAWLLAMQKEKKSFFLLR